MQYSIGGSTGLGYYSLKPMPYGLKDPNIQLDGCGSCCNSCAKGLKCEGDKHHHHKKKKGACCAACAEGKPCTGFGLGEISMSGSNSFLMTAGVLALAYFGGKYIYENYMQEDFQEEPIRFGGSL